MVLDLTPKPPPSFFPHHLPHTSQLQGWFLARPKAVFSSPSTLIPLSWLAQMAAPHRSDIDAKLIVTVSKGSVSPFYTLPNSHQLPAPHCGSQACCPLAAAEAMGEKKDSHHPPTSKTASIPLGWWLVDAGVELFR